MWDFSIGNAFALVMRTLPFVVLRIIVYAGITVAFIVVVALGAGVGWGIGAFGSPDFRAGTIFWGGLIGFVLTAGVLFFLREYILYLVKAGHIAVLVRLLEGEAIPDGRGQIDYGTAVVKERFAEANVLFAFDQLIKGVLAAILGLVQGITAILPIPGVQNLMGIVRAFLRLSLGLVDEVILGHAIHTNSSNPWASAERALVLYAQNWQVMFKNAGWLTAFSYGLAFLIFLLMLAPAGLLVYAMPGGWSAGGFVFALIFAWAVKAAVIEPFAIAAMLETYFRVTDGQAPDPEWDRRISGVSRKFNELKDRAVQWADGGMAAGGASPAGG